MRFEVYIVRLPKKYFSAKIQMVFYVKLFWRENSKTRFAGKECVIILKNRFWRENSNNGKNRNLRGFF